MTCHFSGMTGERWSHGKQRLKRWVLRRLRKMASDGAEVTCCGRLFQIRGPATGKARSPTVDSRVRRTISDDVEAERAADDIELRCLLAARVRRRGTAVLHLADICKQVTGMQPFSNSSERLTVSCSHKKFTMLSQTVQALSNKLMHTFTKRKQIQIQIKFIERGLQNAQRR